MIELRQAIFKFKQDMGAVIRRDTKFTPLHHMEKLSKQLEQEIGAKDATGVSLEDIEQIIKHIRQGKVLTNKEKGELPFVMAAKCCELDDFEKCLKQIDFSKKRTLRRLVFVFFLNYSILKAWQKYGLGRLIQKELSLSGTSQMSGFMSMMKKYVNVIFVKNSPQNIARVINGTNGIINCVEKMNLPEQLKFSSLIIEAVKSYYTEIKAPLANKIDILDETLSNHAIFVGIMPCIADGLIKSVYKDNTDYKNEYKKRCIDVFYEILGDPRFGHRTVRWNDVSDESRRIFLSWLAEKDLDLFFRIIGATADGRMWSDRKNFWDKYMPYVVNSWIVFGNNAMHELKKIEHSKLSYGKLEKSSSADNKQSLFAFQVGKYVFVEWSHNGALRVWDIDEAPSIFGKTIIGKQEVAMIRLDDNLKYKQVHNGNWQDKVEHWIYINCGVLPI